MENNKIKNYNNYKKDKLIRYTPRSDIRYKKII